MVSSSGRGTRNGGAHYMLNSGAEIHQSNCGSLMGVSERTWLQVVPFSSSWCPNFKIKGNRKTIGVLKEV